MKLKDKKIEILAVQSVINENGYAVETLEPICPPVLDLCQYFGQKKLKYYADFFSSSSSLCCGVI